MKNLKMFKAAFAVTVLSFITGCSDQFTSSGKQDLMPSDNGITLDAGRQIDRPLFHTQIRLKPNLTYTFNHSNTGLISFNSIKVERLDISVSDDNFTIPCKDIKVYSIIKQKSELSCNSSNFNLKEIVVMNTGSSMIHVDVVLLGEKRPVKNSELE